MQSLHATAVAAVQAAEAAVKELGREGLRALSALEGVAWELQQVAPMEVPAPQAEAEPPAVSEPPAPVVPVKEAEPVVGVGAPAEQRVDVEPPVPEFAGEGTSRDSSGE